MNYDSKTNLQPSLFDKFESVVIDETASSDENRFNLPDEDLRYCNNVQRELDVIMENLRDCKALCEAVKTETGQSERYCTFKNMSKSLCYFPDADFDQKEREAKQCFIHLISQHFNKKYNLKDINFSELYELENLSYKNLVDKIFLEFGDIINCGVSNLKSDFREDFVKLSALDEPKPPKLNKNKISLKARYWYNANWDYTKYGFESSNNMYKIFKRALLYFETGDITAEKNMNFPLAGYAKWLDFSAPYELISEKVKSIKFFKNSRVDIVFKSSEYAKEFYDMFDMAHPIDQRR